MEIEKNVPIPERTTKQANQQVPYRQMEVGDSVYLTGDLAKRQYDTIRMWAWRRGKKFCVRSDADGMRVWRIA